MLRIFTNISSQRLNYSCEVIFGRILGIEHQIILNGEEFNLAEGPKINYSLEHFPGSLQIIPSGLLFETGVKQHNPPVDVHEGYPVIYPVNPGNGEYHFDIFAAVFYMISRYEEYLPHPKDQYGRFPAFESLAYKNGFLEVPIVNIWVLKLGLTIKKAYPDITFNLPPYRYIPTVDIDIAFKYKYRNPYRTIGGMFRSILQGNWEELKERCLVIAGGQQDPFDTFGFLSSTHRAKNLEAIYFLLLADYGGYDKSISPENPYFVNFILGLSSHAKLGLHPSYKSNENLTFFEQEIAHFERISAQKVIRTRQHFLKLSIPTTWKGLVINNIQEDFSLGFADLPGFRAGICTPYPFYDLSLEKQTNLILYPLILMDGTLNDYMKIPPEEALRLSKILVDRVKDVNGTMITLWHNESLSETGRWKGWKDIYPAIVDYASAK
jgi:hypothetical protein